MDPDQTNQTSQSTDTAPVEPQPIPVVENPPPVQPEPVIEQPSQNSEPPPVVQDTQTPPTSPTTPDIPDSPDSPNLPKNSPPTSQEPLAPVPENPVPQPTPQINIPDLHFPFYGSVSPSLLFNQIPDDERIKQKFQEWGIVGHNGLDYPLIEGTEVLASDTGKVTVAGPNGDYGTCVVIQHSWGQSYYAHLKETKITVDQEVKATDLIGSSDTSGTAFGAHLHFAISPNNPDTNNGYLGFIDPAPYLQNITQKPEPPKPPEEVKPVEPVPTPELSAEKPKEEPPPVPQPEIPEPVIEPTINIEPTPAPVSSPEPPQIPQNPQPPQVSSEDIQKQVDEKLNTELEARRLKANETRKVKQQEHLQAIEKLLQEKKEITNQDVRDLTHVSQTTATEYLSMLVKSGSIKMEGKGPATVYKNIFS